MDLIKNFELLSNHHKNDLEELLFCLVEIKRGKFAP
jgi:hypothetical protein